MPVNSKMGSVSDVCGVPCPEANCVSCESANVLGKVFDGACGAAVVVYLSKTPGKGARRARIQVNARAASNVKKVHDALANISYEDNPEKFELRVTQEFVFGVPELVSAINYAQSNGSIVTEIVGLPGPGVDPKTPDNGVVDEPAVAAHIVNLVGAFAGALGYCGFAYSGENNGKLLRVVAPNIENAGQASSQGFADDLGMHMDNANRKIPYTFDPARPKRGPMNAFQAFATVTPCPNTPMEVAALQDVVHEVIGEHGIGVITALEQPNFSVCKPDSHGGGLDIVGVPVLVRDDKAQVHGRFHLSNVVGMSPEAEAALEKFRAAVLKTQSIIKIPGRKNGLVLYSNTQCMHRRSRYTPKFDSRDRYYVRLYLAPSDVLTAFSAYAVGRVFD